MTFLMIGDEEGYIAEDQVNVAVVREEFSILTQGPSVNKIRTNLIRRLTRI